MTSSPTLELSNGADGIRSIAADTSILQSASSFVSSSSGRSDSRSADAFELVTTAFCNGAKLFLPLPQKNLGELPILLDLWKGERSVSEVTNLELTDKAFEDIGEPIGAAFADYAEGVPYDIARWLAFQFTDEIVGQFTSRTDIDTLMRTAPLAARLIDSGRLEEFRRALLDLQKTTDFREPRVFESLIGAPEIPSLPHLCASYALNVCLRGWSYAVNLSALPERPVYYHLWLRSPALRTNIGIDVTREVASTSESMFPWGRVLRQVFDPSQPALLRSVSNVREVLQGIRELSASFRRSFFAERSVAYEGTTSPSGVLKDRELLVLETLRKVGVEPLYADTKRAERFAQWLRRLTEKEPLISIPVEVVTSTLQHKWIRRAEAALRIRFRRDTFWDIFRDPGISRAVQEFDRHDDT